MGKKVAQAAALLIGSGLQALPQGPREGDRDAARLPVKKGCWRGLPSVERGHQLIASGLVTGSADATARPHHTNLRGITLRKRTPLACLVACRTTKRGAEVML